MNTSWRTSSLSWPRRGRSRLLRYSNNLLVLMSLILTPMASMPRDNILRTSMPRTRTLKVSIPKTSILRASTRPRAISHQLALSPRQPLATYHHTRLLLKPRVSHSIMEMRDMLNQDLMINITSPVSSAPSPQLVSSVPTIMDTTLRRLPLLLLTTTSRYPKGGLKEA